MADFDITINFPDISYVSKTNNISLKECLLGTETHYPFRMLDVAPNFSLLSSYDGDFWKTLTITNISKTNNRLLITYNGTEITNADLPLNINITPLTAIDIIPNLEFVLYDDFNYVLDTEYVNMTFTITDINNNTGEAVLCSSQLTKIVCEPGDPDLPPVIDPPVITSYLYAEILNSGWTVGPGARFPHHFQYQIIATNNPGKYRAINLPSFLECNINTGWITIKAGQEPVIGTFNFNITAQNEAGTDTKPFQLISEYTVGEGGEL